MTTYAAVLRDRQIEWQGDRPRSLDAGRPINVFVTVPEESAISNVNQGQQLAAALEQLAQLGTFRDTDAARWQREIRADRPLPDRVG